MKAKKKDFLLILCRIILGMVFLYSGYLKLTDPVLFSESVRNYQVLGIVLSGWIAVIIPMLEVILGLSLLFGLWLKESIILTVLLYVLFDVMITQAMIRGLDISCGCFDPSESGPIDIYKILQNVILTLLSFWALFLIHQPSGQQVKRVL